MSDVNNSLPAKVPPPNGDARFAAGRQGGGEDWTADDTAPNTALCGLSVWLRWSLCCSLIIHLQCRNTSTLHPSPRSRLWLRTETLPFDVHIYSLSTHDCARYDSLHGEEPARLLCLCPHFDLFVSLCRLFCSQVVLGVASAVAKRTQGFSLCTAGRETRFSCRWSVSVRPTVLFEGQLETLSVCQCHSLWLTHEKADARLRVFV